MHVFGAIPPAQFHVNKRKPNATLKGLKKKANVERSKNETRRCRHQSHVNSENNTIHEWLDIRKGQALACARHAHPNTATPLSTHRTVVQLC